MGNAFPNIACCSLRASNSNHLTHLNLRRYWGDQSCLGSSGLCDHLPASWQLSWIGGCHSVSLFGQLLCSQDTRLIKQMLVNKQVITEMNLHLSIKKLYLHCFSYEHINLVYGKRANMWQMGNLSSIAFVVLPERTVTMATK